MRIYHAGGVASREQERMLTSIAGVRHRLLSFADIDERAKEAFEFWTSARAPCPFFLDSGAFGACTRGVTIDLDRYCDYIEEHADRVNPYASLDVIGDWRRSAANYDAMRARGLQPIPTFHMGSPGQELRRLLLETDHLALGGLVRASPKRLRPWLDACFAVINEYWPRKIHAFGLTAPWALERYPFCTADSATALIGAGQGRVSVFTGGRMRSMPWREYASQSQCPDTFVMDGISPMRIRSGSAHRGRTVRNIEAFQLLEQHVTEYWAERQVVWAESAELAVCVKCSAVRATSLDFRRRRPEYCCQP